MSFKQFGQKINTRAYFGLINIVGVTKARDALLAGLSKEFSDAHLKNPDVTVDDLTREYFKDSYFQKILDKLQIQRDDIINIAKVCVAKI